jgi:hypothetical protein
MKVFLDASVLYSAARPGSLMAKFVARLGHDARLCSNEYAMDETRRNLKRNEPACLPHLEELGRKLEWVKALLPLPEIKLREKDRPILEAAAAAHCSHLVTSDRRDFGPFFGKSIMGVKVLSPQMMANELGLPPSRPKRKR